MEPLLKELRTVALKVVFSALSNYSYYRYTSLGVGACSIAVARLKMGLKPVWPAELAELTMVAWDSIENCFIELVERMGF